MATHAKTAVNGNGNGHGNGHSTKLDRLLAYHEQVVSAIRLTMGLLHTHATTQKTNGHQTVLAQALAMDDARTTKTRKRAKPAKRSGKHYRGGKITQQREQSQAILDAFSTAKVRSSADVVAQLGFPSVQSLGIGPLVRYGYLKPKGDGFVRTAKAYTVSKAAHA